MSDATDTDTHETDPEESDGCGESSERDGADRGLPAERSGRTLLVVVFVGAVSLAGGFGFFVGSIGLRALDSVDFFGVTVFAPTPIGMALYGMTATALVLGTLFVGARFALAREDRPSRGR